MTGWARLIQAKAFGTGVLQFLKLFGIEYFMVSGTLEPNFWNSEISGRLKFHLGSTKFDLRGTSIPS